MGILLQPMAKMSSMELCGPTTMMGASELAAGVPVTGIQWKPKPNMKRRETLVATVCRTNLKWKSSE